MALLTMDRADERPAETADALSRAAVYAITGDIRAQSFD